MEGLKPGDRVKLIRLDNSIIDLHPGALGTVDSYTMRGALVVLWDTGERLALIPGLDQYEAVGEPTPEPEE